MNFRISFMIVYFTIFAIRAEVGQEDIAKRPLLLVPIEKKEAPARVEESEIKEGNALSDDHASDEDLDWHYKFFEPPHVEDSIAYKNVHDIDDKKPITYPKNTKFFCSAEGDEEFEAIAATLLPQRCLFSSSIKKQCKKEIQPTVQKAMKGNEQIECGVGDTNGKLYNVGYVCCHIRTEEGYYPAVEHFHDIYDLCYDDESEQVLYIHYQILIPKFLNYEIFKEDREWVRDELSTDDYDTFGNVFEERKAYMDSVKTDSKNSYTPVTLASPHHMALVQWKIPFFHYLNVVLIHEDLQELWNRFHEYIGSMAAKNIKTRFIIRSGVYYFSRPIKEQPHPLAFWFLISGEEKLKSVGVVIHNLSNSEDIPEEQCLCKSSKDDPLKEVVEQWEGIPNEAKNHMYACEAEDMINFIKY